MEGNPLLRKFIEEKTGGNGGLLAFGNCLRWP